MIFSAPRFVVVDDKVEHLGAILNAFQQLGSPCIGIHYKPDQDLDPIHFRGVRALFLDLHLVDGIAKTDNRSQYAQIAAILEGQISPTGGPFILVVWTENSQLSQELTKYLDDGLDKQKPHAHPLAVLCLAKEMFINVGDGTVTAPDELRKAVSDAVTSNPQLAALLGWEADALVAAGDTLAELLKLVPVEERISTSFPGALNVILSRLAREAVGRPNVEVNHRAAITTALAPILADRMLNKDASPETIELWKRAVTSYDDDTLKGASPEEAGRINRMLHLAISGSETIRATDWGAVVDLPAEIGNTDDELRRAFDGTLVELLDEEFKIKAADYAKCRPCLVRVGAACDYAQKRRGPLTYLLGLEIPADLKRSVSPPGSEWKSPVVMLDGVQAPFRLHVNVRFPLSRPAAACEAWQVRYRLRDQLLMLLVSHSSGYTSRPGIVQLPTK